VSKRRVEFRSGPRRIVGSSLVAIALLASGVSFVAAQTPPRSQQSVPSAVAPLLEPRQRPQTDQGSTFVPPPAVADERELDWRAANEDAARLGGHVGQARERPPAPRR
jgi:hypothetical protein